MTNLNVHTQHFSGNFFKASLCGKGLCDKGPATQLWHANKHASICIHLIIINKIYEHRPRGFLKAKV